MKLIMTVTGSGISRLLCVRCSRRAVAADGPTAVGTESEGTSRQRTFANASEACTSRRGVSTHDGHEAAPRAASLSQHRAFVDYAALGRFVADCCVGRTRALPSGPASTYTNIGMNPSPKTP